MNRYNRGYPEDDSYPCRGRRCGTTNENRPIQPENPNPCAKNVVLPLAFSYVPSQLFEDLYSPQDALACGTLFAALDKPYEGGHHR